MYNREETVIETGSRPGWVPPPSFDSLLPQSPTMEEREQPAIRITDQDISEANQLSLSCPICGSAVENHTHGTALVPVVCDKCGTLYHRACWEQSGGKCAVLGCNHDKFHVYGRDNKPVLKVKYTDLPAPSSVPPVAGPQRTNQRLKEQQRREVQRMNQPTLWDRFVRWLMEQIKVGN